MRWKREELTLATQEVSVCRVRSSPLLVSRDIGPDRDREGNDEFWTLLIAHPMFCLLR